jgi:hypothetical protein
MRISGSGFVYTFNNSRGVPLLGFNGQHASVEEDNDSGLANGNDSSCQLGLDGGEGDVGTIMGLSLNGLVNTQHQHLAIRSHVSGSNYGRGIRWPYHLISILGSLNSSIAISG